MKKAAIIIGIVGLIGTGLYFYYKKQITLLEDFTYKIIGFSLDHVTLTDAVINIAVRIYSESKLQAEISDLNLDVYISGIKVGNVREAKPFIIPANGFSDITLKIKINPLEIGQNAVDLVRSYLGNNKDAEIKINGFGRVQSALIPKTSFPFYYTTTVKEIMSS